MVRVFAFILTLVIAVKESSSAAVFDPNKCSDGCKTSKECPANAHCVAVTQSSDCGLCLCEAGYRTEGTSCVPNDKSKSVKSSDRKSTGGSKEKDKGDDAGGDTPATSAPDPTLAAEDTTTMAPTTTTSPGTTTQGAPPGPIPLKCSDYSCSTQIEKSDSDNPFTVRAQLFNDSSDCKRKLGVAGRPCKMNGGGTCYGVYCLTVDPGNDYCICPFYRVDRQCAVDKPGNCDAASGQLPSNGYKAQNKRFRNKNSPDNGSVYGRHFAESMDDCVKACQWSDKACRAVNYGTLAGQKVCELLSVAATKGGPIESWLVDAPGWQYAQVQIAGNV